ncbi:MAG: polymer-forming cytoskeletal protein [Xanthobacteraceae bacterium]
MFKSKGLEKDMVASAAAIAQRECSTVDQQPATPVSTPVSCIGSGMSIVGNVECSGSAQVFGRIEGELRATELVIGEGAQIEGSIQAQEVTISGRVKGTIRAIRVSLLRANVEGDIIHRTLSIDEASVFEGMSRRVENPVERRTDNAAESSSSTAPKAAQKKTVPSPSVVPAAVPASNGALQPN